MKSEKDLEKILKGLANRRRLAIIKLLAKQKELSVADIAQAIKLSFTATSKHLGILRQLDILDRNQVSLTVYYSLSHPLPDAVQKLFTLIANLSNSSE